MNSDNFWAKVVLEHFFLSDSEFCLSAYKLRSAAWNFEFAQLSDKKSSWREFFWGVKIFENFSIFFHFFLKIFALFFSGKFSKFSVPQFLSRFPSVLVCGLRCRPDIKKSLKMENEKNQKKNSEKNRISRFRDTFDCFEGVRHADLTFRSPAWPVIREVFCRKQWS